MHMSQRVRKTGFALMFLALVTWTFSQVPVLSETISVPLSSWTSQGTTLVGTLRFEHPWRLVASCSSDNEVMVQLDETETHTSSREEHTSLRLACTGHTVTSRLLLSDVSYIVAVTATGPWSP